MCYILRKERWGAVLFNSSKRKYWLLNDTAFFMIKKLLIYKDRTVNSKILDFVKKMSMTIDNTRIVEFSNDFYPLTSPLYVDWYITPKCNLKCKYCFLTPQFWEIPELNIFSKHVIANQLVTSGVFEVTLLGGEPLMDVAVLLEIVQILTSNYIKVDISTNGLLLQKFTKYVSEFDIDKELVTISVSIQSLDPVILEKLTGFRYEIRQIFLKIEKLLQNNWNVAVTTVLTHLNIEEIPKIFEKCSKIGIKSYTIFYPYTSTYISLQAIPSLSDILALRNKLRKLKEQKDIRSCYHLVGAFNFLLFNSNKMLTHIKDEHPFNKLGTLFCKAGITKLDILPDGSVVPCILFPPNSWKLGNLLEGTSLRDIWGANKKLYRLRDRKYPKKCKECIWKETCRGGCAGESYNKYMSIDRPDPRCPIIKGEKWNAIQN